MILREMSVQECWCASCHAGQMGQIHDIMMKEKVTTKDLVGRKIICEKCGTENEIEDVIHIIPTAYLVTSNNMINKAKSNDELHNWLKSDTP